MAKPPTKSAVADLNGPDRNTYKAMLAVLTAWGIPSLAGTLLKYVQQGYDANTISVLLPETKEYKQRFAANEARQKAGLAVLSPAEYIATERAYEQAARQAGLPKGFYDQHSDFTKLLSADVSPTEFSQRVTLASQEIYNRDPEQVALLKQWYPSLGKGDLTAAILDPVRALPLLQKQIDAADIGLAAKSNDVAISAARAELLSQHGVSTAQAQQGFGQVNQLDQSYKQLAGVYGGTYGAADSEAEVFGLEGASEATQKRKGLASQERAQFGGSSGIGSTSLKQTNNT